MSTTVTYLSIHVNHHFCNFIVNSDEIQNPAAVQSYLSQIGIYHKLQDTTVIRWIYALAIWVQLSHVWMIYHILSKNYTTMFGGYGYIILNQYPIIFYLYAFLNPWNLLKSQTKSHKNPLRQEFWCLNFTPLTSLNPSVKKHPSDPRLSPAPVDAGPKAIEGKWNARNLRDLGTHFHI